MPRSIEMHSNLNQNGARKRHTFLAFSILMFGVMMLAVQIRSTVAVPAGSFKVVKLIGSKGTGAARRDSLMVNAWGSAFFPGDPFWINDDGTGFSELIDGKGRIFKSLPSVTVPGATGGVGKPTGIVANGTGQFP